MHGELLHHVAIPAYGGTRRGTAPCPATPAHTIATYIVHVHSRCCCGGGVDLFKQICASAHIHSCVFHAAYAPCKEHHPLAQCCWFINVEVGPHWMVASGIHTYVHRPGRMLFAGGDALHHGRWQQWWWLPWLGYLLETPCARV